MKRISIVTLIIALAIPLLVGGVSAALSAKGMASYGTMIKPPLSPPAWVFSVAWTILYLMMGFSSYMIIASDAEPRKKTMALIIYIVQLFMNFMWSIIFFNGKLYLAAFIWLIVMWLIVIFCAFRFYGINRGAAYLLVPYIMWLTFAAYLNLGAYILDV